MNCKHALVLAAFFATLANVAPDVSARANVDLFIGVPPPALVVEPVPPPRPEYIWVPGYWRWDGHRHVWAKGHWIRERRGWHYVAPHWDEDGARWRFRPGHWEH
ncbi:MAG: YXWGXW repeat-containing protein [Burkholderiales bacterium]